MKYKKPLILLGILALICLAAFGWDFYMRQSWDDHITSNTPHHIYKTETGRAGGVPLTPEQIIATPELYKRPLEIVQNGTNTYTWVSNDNIELTRTNEEDGGLKWFVFKPADGSAEIRILANGNVGNAASGANSCYAGLMQGNIKITYKGGPNGDLTTAADTYVYTGPEQYIQCNSSRILSFF
ncbi:MAG: hypothetical protein AB7E85_05835 [Pseudobdellovibrionaceae bacterium]